MDPVTLNGVIFFSMYALSLGTHRLVEKCTEIQHNAAHMHGFSGALATVVTTHAPVVDSVREFLVHVVVYSGHVIPKH